MFGSFLTLLKNSLTKRKIQKYSQNKLSTLRELFTHGLGSVAALPGCWKIDFCVSALEVQLTCIEIVYKDCLVYRNISYVWHVEASNMARDCSILNKAPVCYFAVVEELQL